MSAASVQRVDVFQRDGWQCFAKATILGHVCDGHLQCAHFLPAAETRNYIRSVQATPWRHPNSPFLWVNPDEVIYDPDCAVPMCSRGGHVPWDQSGVRCTYEQLPARVVAWAKRWGLEHRLEDYYRRQDFETNEQSEAA